MNKTKYQRGLCVWHGCKSIGTITPNATQRFCQEHWIGIQQAKERHEKAMQESRERMERIRAKLSQP